MANDVGVLVAPQQKDLLRFLTCGSVDDGKSTLIGRLLYECSLVLDDQLAALEHASRRFGTTGGDLDFSLLLDGLEDERQQKITIDVAYRFFATPERAFAVADTPGHEQYTRNMATGASNCELAVNKMDLVGFDEHCFEEISANFVSFSARLGDVLIQVIPLSARCGDNVA